jgi:DeoR/GlpR family transcriptional regulator of sugar metabolism
MEIIRLATTSGLASVEQLSTRFDVTPSTIRRDLAILTKAGKIARTYGGAISLAPHPEATLRQRLGTAYAAKHAIGRWAAEQVRPGETVLLDAGTTTGAMAQELSHRKDITVATCGMTTLQALAEASGIELLVLGGRLRAVSQGLVGPLAESTLARLTFDRAFMGADAVSVENGICEADLEQTALKEKMMQRSAEVYVLAHSEKLEQRPFHAWAIMPPRWTLVTDEDADPAVVQRFRDRGVDVCLVAKTTSVSAEAAAG